MTLFAVLRRRDPNEKGRRPSTSAHQRLLFHAGSMLQSLAVFKSLTQISGRERMELAEDLQAQLQEFFQILQRQANFPACAVCDRYGHGYMIHDELWDEAANDDERYLCLACVEDRLGRRLALDDFTDAPINVTVLDAIQIGADAEEFAHRVEDEADDG